MWQIKQRQKRTAKENLFSASSVVFLTYFLPLLHVFLYITNKLDMKFYYSNCNEYKKKINLQISKLIFFIDLKHQISNFIFSIEPSFKKYTETLYLLFTWHIYLHSYFNTFKFFRIMEVKLKGKISSITNKDGQNS